MLDPNNIICAATILEENEYFESKKQQQQQNNTLYVDADLENVLVGIFMTLFWLFK